MRRENRERTSCPGALEFLVMPLIIDLLTSLYYMQSEILPPDVLISQDQIL
jgi:hypothetical protein